MSFLSSIFGGGSVPRPAPLPPLPDPNAGEVQRRRRLTREAARRRRGRGRTILAGNLAEEATTTKPTLLGA